jgi:hypothetical protein
VVSPTVDPIPGVGLLYYVRRSDEEVRRRLHLQAWHVRQLFPDRA